MGKRDKEKAPLSARSRIRKRCLDEITNSPLRSVEGIKRILRNYEPALRKNRSRFRDVNEVGRLVSRSDWDPNEYHDFTGEWKEAVVIMPPMVHMDPGLENLIVEPGELKPLRRTDTLATTTDVI